MKILVLDNYDSFTYNLVQLLTEHGGYDISVFRNDEISLEGVSAFDKIVLSPGPGIPSEAGLLCPIIQHYKAEKPIFGVCLGLQAIGEVFGGKLVNIAEAMHGVATHIQHTNSPLFTGIPNPFQAGRYHSWAVSSEGLPTDLQITATDENGTIMALEHKYLRVSGVQFHPESILSEYGKELIGNFLKN
jgi:anthranilate synthase component 2